MSTDKSVVLLIGESGAGKSTMIKTVVNDCDKLHDCMENDGPGCGTSVCAVYGPVKDCNGKEYHIIDTRGFGDTQTNETKIMTQIISAIQSVGYIHLAIMVFKDKLSVTERKLLNLIGQVLNFNVCMLFLQ
jgi:septin family protein